MAMIIPKKSARSSTVKIPGDLTARIMKAILKSPARTSILGFALLIGIGTVLLTLPAAASTRRLGWIDALFTFTSASCVTGLVVADATDVRVLDSLGIQDVDAAVVCIGSDLSNSILVALNLKDLDVKQVMAKALSEAHGHILLKICVTDYLFPEKDMAISLAERLHNPNMLDYLPFL